MIFLSAFFLSILYGLLILTNACVYDSKELDLYRLRNPFTRILVVTLTVIPFSFLWIVVYFTGLFLIGVVGYVYRYIVYGRED